MPRVWIGWQGDQDGPGTEPLLIRFAGFSKGEPCRLVEVLCSEDDAGLVRPQESKGLDWRARLADVRRLLVTGVGRSGSSGGSIVPGSVMSGMDILWSVRI
jgi:hypothetical protein